ncbi:MAG: 2-amino-4-hydroxy-6-hydroxymethyldihydropteridine diphosphokinase [Chthoniobacterales bacterium]|nr:MAG: 2-amino-4-hydroxy-6-hydroxymethyldihydropteridine diphosphokinase [Chthoniobacterales bacterium]
MRAGVALGTNLGDRLSNFRKARQEIEALDDVAGPVLASAIYETEPVGCKPGAPKFLNAVIEFKYAGSPQELLSRLGAIECSLGRPAQHEKNSSRPIDLDLLYFGDAEIQVPGLRLPHPRMMERQFVLRPLVDIRPDLILPKQTKTIRALVARLPEEPAVVRFEAEW